MISKQDFISTCTSYGLENSTIGDRVTFVLDGCWLFSFYNNKKIVGTDAYNLSYVEEKGLIWSERIPDPNLHNIHELKENIESCIKKWKELKKEYIRNKIKDI